MKLNSTEKLFIKFVFYFTVFFFIQLINSDFMFNYDMGKKAIFSFLTTVVFLLASHFIKQKD